MTDPRFSIYPMGSPKFTGPGYVEYFWDKFLNGWNDAECDNSDPLFVVCPEDIQAQPELCGKRTIRLHENEEGLVFEVDSDTGIPLAAITISLNPPVELSTPQRGFKAGYSRIMPAEISVEYMRGYVDGLEKRDLDG